MCIGTLNATTPEHIGSDGIVMGHAFSLLGVNEIIY